MCNQIPNNSLTWWCLVVFTPLPNSERTKHLNKCTVGLHMSCSVFSPSLQLKWSPERCCIQASLWFGLPVQPPLHLWLPVLGFRVLNEGLCFLSCSLKKGGAVEDRYMKRWAASTNRQQETTLFLKGTGKLSE